MNLRVRELLTVKLARLPVECRRTANVLVLCQARDKARDKGQTLRADLIQRQIERRNNDKLRHD